MTKGALGGVVLAGGLARRMGGIDKGLVRLGGRSMCEWVVAAVRPEVEALVINANRNVEQYAALGLTVVPDLHEGYLGPLAGLSAGLAALDTELVFMCPCDSPFVSGELVNRLAFACRQSAIDVAVAHDGEREQPAFCVVHQRVAASLADFLDAGERKIDRWYAGQNLSVVDCGDLADAFRNFNTLEELALAEQALREQDLSERVPAERAVPEHARGTLRIERQPSCDDPAEPELLPVGEARARLAAMIAPVRQSEHLGLRQCLGRVLAQAVYSPSSVPAQDNSAMDGYAISAASIPDTGVAALQLMGTAWAGTPYEGAVAKGQAVRIFTGGIMPAGADTVVIQEHCEIDDDRVSIDSRVEPGRNVRAAGEDVAYGALVFAAGERLDAAHLGVLASLGIAMVPVVRRIRVAFFSTGTELRSLDEHADEPLPPGALFDSNRYALTGLLADPMIEAIDLGLIPDDPDITRTVLQSAAGRADLIISSGGVSAGDADHVSRVLHEVGEVAFWKIAIRPGRPLAVGRIDDAMFFALPGNPVAVMVTFLRFVRPALQSLMGMVSDEPALIPARCTTHLRKSVGREEYQRGRLSTEADGQLTVASTGKQGAGRLTSMSNANCLIVLAAERGSVEPGETVHVQLFHGLLG